MHAPLLIVLAAYILLPGFAEGTQKDPRLDNLFPALKTAETLDEAHQIETDIWSTWGEIENVESARLLEQGTNAMGRRAWSTALQQFNELIAREPEFAEAWNKRATLYYLIGDYRASIDDIAHTLRLEPRHFGALSGLGLIYMRLDKPEAALKSFEAALALHPMLPGALSHVEVLRERLAGSPI
jgi:tetratricopeptide (TPR) repeat protein